MYEQINFTYIYLLVYFLSSISTIKAALKTRNSLTAPSTNKYWEQFIFQLLEKPERECFFCQITTWQILQTLDCIRRFKRIWAEKKISKYVLPSDLIWSNLLKVTESQKVFQFGSKKEPNLFPEHLLFWWIVLRRVIWAKVKKTFWY